MNLKIILLSLFIVFSGQSYAQKVEIRSSRLHGLLVFIFSNMQRSGYSPFLKEMTDRSEYKDQMKKILENSVGIERNLSLGLNYADSVKGYNDGFGPDDLFEIQSAYATDIDDLFVRLQKTIPMEELLKFKKIFKESEPIYEQLIWSKYRSHILEIENLYQKNSVKWNLAGNFKKAKSFYNSVWPEDLDFKITLYPIPPEAKHSNAHSMAAFESVGVIINEKDHVGRFGVIFHEIMHSLYSAQSLDFKKQLLSYYELEKKDSDLPYRIGAYKFANEVFATVLGNGWFYEVIAGEKDKSSWYNEIHIETLARAMFDLTKQYLVLNKKIDQHYIEQYIQLFKKSFPNYENEKDFIFSEVDVFHTNKKFNSQEIRKAIRSIVQPRGMGIIGSSTLFEEKIEIDQNRTNMFLITDDEVMKMTKAFKNKIGLPKKVQNQILKGKTGLWKWISKNKNTHILAVVKDGDLRGLFTADFNLF